MGAYYDDAQVKELTDAVVARGESLLQIFREHDDEREQADFLRRQADPLPGDTIIDAGCGTGAMARHWHEADASLKFKLLNIGEAQLKHADPDMEQSVGDLEAMPYPPACANGVVFSYVLGHCDLDKALSEAWRVLRPGGWIFIYDMASMQQSRVLNYDIRPMRDLFKAIQRHGFHWPQAWINAGKSMSKVCIGECGGLDQLKALLEGVSSISMKFHKPTGEAHEC